MVYYAYVLSLLRRHITLKLAHVAVGNIHMAGNQTLKRILWSGVWWPTIRQETHEYVRQCKDCQTNRPLPHATLFQVSIAPKWSKYIVEYLTQHLLPEKISKARRKAIEIEAKDFEIIANQLYKRGKDKQLRLCVT